MMRSAWPAFALFFGLYLATMPPALAPYRDAGEMTVSASTLGVSHPTGYPLYILCGRLFEALPLGNKAYRLGLLSAAAAAAALAALYLTCRRRWGAAAAWGAVLLLGLNSTFWSVSLVTEMYSLWALGAIALIGLALRLGEGRDERRWLFFAGFFGFLLANRLDLLLWAPGLLWLSLGGPERAISPRAAGGWVFLAFLAFPALMVGMDSNAPIAPLILATALWLYRGRRAPWALRSAAMTALGLAAYLYLPIRSAAGPWLDWNHPASLANLMETLLRTKYGGTLDLLSKNYAVGELFAANMAAYGRHLWANFSAPGLTAVLVGFCACRRRDFRRWLGMGAAYWWSGPVFLFMANMPPNPHALAIVEPHYLLSDIVLLLWAAEGFSWIKEKVSPQGVPSYRAWAAGALIAALAAAPPLMGGRLAQANRREHLFSYDYAKNVFRSALPGGVVVAKKDVQLYSLWHYQTVQGWRPDLRIVSQGLAGSSWYQNDWRRRDPTLLLGPLRDAAGWRGLADLNGAVFATQDAEPPLPPSQITPRGLLLAVKPVVDDASGVLWALQARRGNYRYEEQPDFFTSDIIDSYAQALYRRGTARYSEGAIDESVADLRSSWSMHWGLPEPSIFLGYIDFTRSRWEPAKRYYGVSVALYRTAVALTDQYHSLPELKASLRRLSADAHVQLGVATERVGDIRGAEKLYRESLSLAPSAQAHFNLAVLYWNKDWGTVRLELSEALRVDPRHAEAAKYFELLGRRPK